jgi:uncharacterized membrane protein YphA (DoxX/SURF4 family)
MDPTKDFRLKHRLKRDGGSDVPTPKGAWDHRDRLSHAKRRESEATPDRPTAVSNNTHWASSPRFIKSGSHIFDEVFRVGMGFPAGMALAFAVFDFRRLAAEQLDAAGTSLVAVGGIARVFAFGAFLVAPVCIAWGFWRQAQLKAIRKKREPLPEPIRWLGLPAMLIGVVGYLIMRTL